jgi:hypothetical protein
MKKYDLILEFLGIIPNQDGTYEFPQHGFLNSNGKWIDSFSKDSLKFDSRPDWIVPVLFKINSLYSLFTEKEKASYRTFFHIPHRTTKELFDCIVAFISLNKTFLYANK